jgi:hypothetical protein
VETGFDTDCNGATVGSVLGMRNGFSGIDSVWTEPFHGRHATTVFSVGIADIDALVERTMTHLPANLV